MSTERSAAPFDPAAVPIKDASTVLLLRDSDRGVEVFLQRRVVGMDFAGGMTVFPGGVHNDFNANSLFASEEERAARLMPSRQPPSTFTSERVAQGIVAAIREDATSYRMLANQPLVMPL